MTLGERLRDLRVHGGSYLAQRQVAERVGMTWPRLSKVESDREKPTVEEVVALGAALGIDSAELLTLLDQWEEAPPPDMSNAIFCYREPRRG